MGWARRPQAAPGVDGLTRVLAIEVAHRRPRAGPARPARARRPRPAPCGTPSARPASRARARPAPRPRRSRPSSRSSRPARRPRRRRPSRVIGPPSDGGDPPWTAHDPVRAPRGTTLTARSWQTEAPLRMLQNNLDPEVAERPDDLVVYGGTGRAARDWRSFDAMVRTLTTLEDDETLLVQSGPAGRRAADPRVGAAGADRQLEPGRRLGDLAGVPPARAARPDDVRADDRRVVDLHRHPGDPAGHLRDVRRRRRQAVRRHAGRHADRHRRLRRHGRRAAAGRDAQRRGVPGRRRRRRRGCDRRVATRYLDEVADDLDDAVERCLAAKRDRRGRCRSGWSATAPPCCPSCCAAASRSTSSPTRPRRTTR